MKKDYKNCPHRMECVASDTFLSYYMACTLENRGREYAECNPGCKYCQYCDSVDDDEE